MNTENVRILKTASCPSLSKKSTLTYNIGANDKSEIQFQLVANTGAGYFNKEWIPQSRIQQVLAKLPKGKGITCSTFRSIFHGKSVNTSGFTVALLRHLGLLGTMKANRRCYELLDPTDFIAEVNALLGAPAEVAAVGKKAKPSTPIQKQTAKGRSKKV